MIKKGYLYRINKEELNKDEITPEIKFLIKRSNNYFLALRKIDEYSFLGVVLTENKSKNGCSISINLYDNVFYINCMNFYVLKLNFFKITNINCYDTVNVIYETRKAYVEKLKEERKKIKAERIKKRQEKKKLNKEKRINNTVQKQFKMARGIKDKNYSGPITICRG